MKSEGHILIHLTYLVKIHKFLGFIIVFFSCIPHDYSQFFLRNMITNISSLLLHIIIKYARLETWI